MEQTESVDVLERVITLARDLDSIDARLKKTEETLAAFIDGRRSGAAGDRKQNWLARPELCLFKCILKPIRRDFIGQDIAAEFKRLVPGYHAYFNSPVSDRAIQGRAYMGSLDGYESEWPENHPRTKPFWDAAQEIYARGKPVTEAEIAYIVEHKRLPLHSPIESLSQTDATEPGKDTSDAER